MNSIKGRTLLITGGTGSFGKHFVQTALARWEPAAIRVFSRDELKQHDMALAIKDPRLRFFIGDVRDNLRLRRACEGADIVIHAAALKHVPACEYNPFEAIKTNVLGAQNVAEAAIDTGVMKAMALSTDKAVGPVNLYGATKLCAEKLFVQSNVYAGKKATRLSCVRYGNVVGSRGSVIPLFREQAVKRQLTITDERMTRFWISLDQAVAFVANCIDEMVGGEIFVPKIPSMKIIDLAEAIAPGVPVKFTGIRSGEKLHESMLTRAESRHTMDFGDHLVVQPEHAFWDERRPAGGTPVAEGFEYTSDGNDHWLDVPALRKLIGDPDLVEQPRTALA